MRPDRETIRLIGRNSRLSLLQIGIVRDKIEAAFPGMNVEIIARSSKGDELQNVPLHTVEGSDFFTKDIFEALQNREADIAVHSLKDMSSEHFFGENRFAVPDRDDTRDVAIFTTQAIEKIRLGQPIIIGTCSPRREEMATVFLKKALPQWGQAITIETKPIRGNVETRLRKLDDGEYDATILATAGLNRLLSSERDAPVVKELLGDKKLMLLPLVECVPAPCQGAIAAEAHPSNPTAIAVLDRINNAKLLADCVQERKKAVQYGKGCLQRFGVTTLVYGDDSVIYAAGRDENDNGFTDWDLVPQIDTAQKNFFSSTDHMGSFFDYEYNKDEEQPEIPVVYVANYKAVQGDNRLIRSLPTKRVWVAGTKTWHELARQGIWVEGCADAFGLEFLEKAWTMPLISIAKEDVQIITNEPGAANWRQKGWKATGTYKIVSRQRKELANQIGEADIVFWTSFQQYQLYKDVLKEKVQHVCPSGETAVLLRSAGLDPIVFPNIKAFQQWKKASSRLPSAG
jgi:hydroxymethylbilane synthase